MTAMFLFCVTESATKWVRKVLAPGPLRTFNLVESSESPSQDWPWRRELTDDDVVRSDFVGATVADCQQWALEKQTQTNKAEFNMIAIADERSSQDDTLLVQYYATFSQSGLLEGEKLPPEINKWYSYRVHYPLAREVMNALNYLEPDVSFPQYFARKEELTDANGVFDVIKAVENIGGRKQAEEWSKEIYRDYKESPKPEL